MYYTLEAVVVLVAAAAAAAEYDDDDDENDDDTGDETITAALSGALCMSIFSEPGRPCCRLVWVLSEDTLLDDWPYSARP